MNWMQKIAQSGWSSAVNKQDLAHALEYVSDFMTEEEMPTQIRSLGLIPVSSLLDPSGWLETDEASIQMPNDLDDQGWNNVIQYLNAEVSSRDFTHIVNAFRRGVLDPIVLHNHDVADGRGRVNFANALGIPVSAIELYL